MTKRLGPCLRPTEQPTSFAQYFTTEIEQEPAIAQLHSFFPSLESTVVVPDPDPR